MNVLRSVKCLAALAGAMFAGSAMAVTGYTVSLVTTNDCSSTGHVLVAVKLGVSGGTSTAAGGQIFLNYGPFLSATNASITVGPGLQGVFTSAGGGAATIAVGVLAPGQTIGNGDTLATIDFTYSGTSCPSAGSLVTFNTGHVPASALTDNAAQSLPFTSSNLTAVTLGDTTAPTFTFSPASAIVAWNAGKDPWATGFATASDTCDPSPVVTYSDNRNALTSCGAIGGRGRIVRTWTATDHCGNSANYVQNIDVIDTTPPVQTGCPYPITQNADAGSCGAVVTFTPPTAYDQQHLQGFETPGFVAADYNPGQSTDWSQGDTAILTRVASGNLGITSASGGFHADIATSPRPSTDGPFTRLGGYGTSFGNGFVTSLDMYIDVADPAVAQNRYTIEITSAASRQNGNHLQDFVFHIQNSSTQAGHIRIAGDNNAYQVRRGDFDTAYTNFADITTSGWYTLRWTFRNNGSGFLACDMQVVDSVGTVIFTETRTNLAADILSTVGGNRYMWFTFIDVSHLAIDNASVRRPLPVNCTRTSGETFASGVNLVNCSSTDTCLNSTTCSFNITVNSSNTLVATVEEAGLSSAAARCVTFDLWRAACSPVASASANIAFNSTNAIDFESYAPGNLPGAGTPTDTRTPGGTPWWLPSNCATSGQVSALAARTGGKGLIVGNNGNGNDGVIDNLKTPRLPFAAGETAFPVSSASSKFRSSYWFRTAATAPADGFAFKSESYGPDRTTYFGTWYQTAFGDTNLNCGVYAIEEISGGVFDFVFHPVASGMTWGAWYRVETTVTFVNGSNNDIVDYRLYNSSNTLIGSALGLHDWEEGARQFGYNGGAVFGVDAVQFQTAGDTSAVGPRDVAYVDDITYDALPTVLIDVPCGASAYSAATATDVKHTLRRTGTGAPNFGTSGTNYYANFTSATFEALQQGNLNNDAYIDILDFGGYIGQFGANYGSGSTLCGASGLKADFSGNGSVGTEDFTFIQSGFLAFRDLDPCGGALVDGGPITDIAVSDLVAGGLRSYAMADFNLDGRLNSADVAYVAQNGLPRCAADFNDDQATNVQDIFSFLNAWFANHPKADLNNNSTADVQDIFSFLNVWFQGC